MAADQLTLFEPATPAPNYGWMGTVPQFLAIAQSDWLGQLCENYQQLYRQRATATQQQAWSNCFEILRSQLELLVEQRSGSVEWTLIFEYELPREGGRRPDLILLGSGQIIVFEFKQKTARTTADIDQVAAYARDLAEYQGSSHQHPVVPVLVLTRRLIAGEMSNGVRVLAAQEICDYLKDLTPLSPVDASGWIQAEYDPLPTIVQAARRIFQQEPLPSIKRARSAGIPDLIVYLNNVVERAKTERERHLVLITGVPGAGKTLVGLQFVYQNHLEVVGKKQAVFLSGNGPLVTVLQYALKSRVFVQAVRNFYLEHEARRQKAPQEHIVVFDEAQRAWDAERMAEKYGIQAAAAGTVLRIAERSPDWCLVLGLIGEGQQIHVGEEDGIEQWNRGLEQASSDWHVHCAPEQVSHFTAIPAARLSVDRRFNLTTSLRSHVAEDVQGWVAHLLSGQFEAAAELMPSLTASGFDAYLTRDLEAAKAYCRDRYGEQPDKRYGLLASSRARNLPHHGIDNSYMATARVNVGAWYIDPPDSPSSCCALTRPVTEFGCQGLELDFPIIGWGDDLLWQSAWVTRSRQKHVRDPLRLRLNSYRVLLTRGRDGFVVFVPVDPKLDSTWAVLRSTGLQEL